MPVYSILVELNRLSSQRSNRKSQSSFVYTVCGYCDHADINAAKNILVAGHAVLACGKKPLGRSMKQEPLRKSD
jgi:putative transposase